MSFATVVFFRLDISVLSMMELQPAELECCLWENSGIFRSLDAVESSLKRIFEKTLLPKEKVIVWAHFSDGEMKEWEYTLTRKAEVALEK